MLTTQILYIENREERSAGGSTVRLVSRVYKAPPSRCFWACVHLPPPCASHPINMDYDPYATYPAMQYSTFQPMPSDFTDFSPADAMYSAEAAPALESASEPSASQPYATQYQPSYQTKDILHWATSGYISSPSVQSTIPTPSSEHPSSRPVIVHPTSTHHPVTSTIGYPEYDLYMGANNFPSSSSHPHQHASELCYDSSNTVQPVQPYEPEYWAESEELNQYQDQDAGVAAGQALDGENANQMPITGEFASTSIHDTSNLPSIFLLVSVLDGRRCQFEPFFCCFASSSAMFISVRT